MRHGCRPSSLGGWLRCGRQVAIQETAQLEELADAGSTQQGPLEQGARSKRRLLHPALELEHHAEDRLQTVAPHGAGQLDGAFAALGRRHHTDSILPQQGDVQEVAQGIHGLLDEIAFGSAALQEGFHGLQDGARMIRYDGLEKVQPAFRTREPGHHLEVIQGDMLAGGGEDLIEHGFRIAHAAATAMGDGAQHLGIDRHALRIADALQLGLDILLSDPAELEDLTARDDRIRDLVRIGGREQEHRMGGRFLEGLQKGIERLPREALHLVDDVDLAPITNRVGLHRIADAADVIYAVVGGPVDLHHIDIPATLDLKAPIALQAGLHCGALHAIHRLGDDPRGGGLADAARADQQVGLTDALALDRLTQGADDVVLPDDLGEATRAIFARENAVGRGFFAHLSILAETLGGLSLAKRALRPEGREMQNRNRRPGPPRHPKTTA